MPGLRPDRPLDLAAVDIDLDDVAGDQAPLLRLAGLMRTALSQQRLVTGFGVSCSQALLARLPS